MLAVLSALALLTSQHHLAAAQNSTPDSSWPALTLHRSAASSLYDPVVKKLWVSFILRENLVEVFETIHNTSTNDPNIDQASEYLYEAFKYGRIDTFPLARAARCMFNRRQFDQLDTALDVLANSSHKYIRCAIEVVKDAVKANIVVVPDPTWDIVTDLNEIGPHLIKNITSPVYRVNTTQAVLQTLWTSISAGHPPPQRLIGMILLNTPSSVPSLSDQIYLGSFLYLEKLSPTTWSHVVTAADYTRHDSVMEYLKAILDELPNYIPVDMNFNIANTPYVVDIPKNLDAFEKLTANLARNIFVYKSINSGARRSIGKKKRTLDGKIYHDSSPLELLELRRNLVQTIEARDEFQHRQKRELRPVTMDRVRATAASQLW